MNTKEATENVSYNDTLWSRSQQGYLCTAWVELAQGSKCWVPRFPQAPNFCQGNSTFHLEFPAGNPTKNAGNLSFSRGFKV